MNTRPERRRKLPLAYSYLTAYGLAFDIIRSRDTKSGYAPARFHHETGLELYGDLRLAGFAAAWRMGVFDTLIIVGRDEPRYEGETIKIENEDYPINQAWVIRQMLIKDCGVDENCVGICATGDPSVGGTDKKIDEIVRMMDSHQGDAGSDLVLAVITNHYHIPRTFEGFLGMGRIPAIFAAETFILAECKSAAERKACRKLLRERLGGTSSPAKFLRWIGLDFYVQRVIAEISGSADYFVGDYVRTATSPIHPRIPG